MLEDIRRELQQFSIPLEERKVNFFKTGAGEYAEHDQFLGVPVPRLRVIAKNYKHISLATTIKLLQSPVNEERLLALMMWIERYQKGNEQTQEEIYRLYQQHIDYVNNWNLVDASAHYIVGAYLYQKDKNYLLELSQSDNLWERRIAIVSTWYFIRQNSFEWTFKISEKLLKDKQDLIHKAVGWMLREMGKRDENQLIRFLERYASSMPRTMLRYSIEKLTSEQKQIYLHYRG